MLKNLFLCVEIKNERIKLTCCNSVALLAYAITTNASHVVSIRTYSSYKLLTRILILMTYIFYCVAIRGLHVTWLYEMSHCQLGLAVLGNSSATILVCPIKGNFPVS